MQEFSLPQLLSIFYFDQSLLMASFAFNKIPCLHHLEGHTLYALALFSVISFTFNSLYIKKRRKVFSFSFVFFVSFNYLFFLKTDDPYNIIIHLKKESEIERK